MSKPGRPRKSIGIPAHEVAALCAGCRYKRCRGTGDDYCPVRIASRERWRLDNKARVWKQRQRYLAKMEALKI